MLFWTGAERGLVDLSKLHAIMPAPTWLEARCLALGVYQVRS
jgi:hypothetical protein